MDEIGAQEEDEEEEMGETRACLHVWVQVGDAPDAECVCVKCSQRASVADVAEYLERLPEQDRSKSLRERLQTDKPVRLGGE